MNKSEDGLYSLKARNTIGTLQNITEGVNYRYYNIKQFYDDIEIAIESTSTPEESKGEIIYTIFSIFTCALGNTGINLKESGGSGKTPIYMLDYPVYLALYRMLANSVSGTNEINIWTAKVDPDKKTFVQKSSVLSFDEIVTYLQSGFFEAGIDLEKILSDNEITKEEYDASGEEVVATV